MKSRTSLDFWRLFNRLPVDIQARAREAYNFWQREPHHPSLHFKRLRTKAPLYSIRIGLGWRAVAIERDDGTLLWFWIGSHADYDALIG